MYSKLDQKLEKLKYELRNELMEISNNTGDFHKQIIELSTKNPDYKEILEFIVFVNDKLETNQHLYLDVIIDTLNSMIETKRQLLAHLETNEHKATPKKGSTNDVDLNKGILFKLNQIKDLKMIAWGIALALIAAGAIFAPDEFKELLNIIKSLI